MQASDIVTVNEESKKRSRSLSLSHARTTHTHTHTHILFLRLNLEGVQNDMKNMRNDIAFLLKSSGKFTSMQINQTDGSEVESLPDENNCLRSQLEDLKSSVAHLRKPLVL